MSVPVKHPQPNDAGEPVLIRCPSAPSAPSAWHGPADTAIFVPGGTVPDAVCGVPDSPATSAPYIAYRAVLPVVWRTRHVTLLGQNHTHTN